MIGYLDCYSGLSGDMLLGALVDAGLEVDRLRAAAHALGIGDEVAIRAEAVTRAGVRATRLHVELIGAPVPRRFNAIADLVSAAPLPASVRATSLAVLTRIAEAEAQVHGIAPNEVELHEVGGLDAIVDVVGSVAGLEELGVDRLYASALPLAPGELRHGRTLLPAPAPATLALLAAAHAPIRPFGAGEELVTPTGAALAATLARFEEPAMRLERVGCGAGAVETAWPNVLRLWLGAATADEVPPSREFVVLETNLDDMSPELLAPATGSLLAAGALDVTVSPLLMKKGRAGWLVSVVAPAAGERALAEVLLRETTTLGVRVHPVRRHEAGRRQAQVETPFGPVSVKLKLLGGVVIGASPEFESVRERAAAAGASPAAVHAAAVAAAQPLVIPGVVEGGETGRDSPRSGG